MSGNPVPYPQGAPFADLLDWHLNFGTRPDGHPDRLGKRWGNQDFANAVGGVSDKSVRNWRTGRNPTSDLPSIERALFGANAAFDAWRFDLRLAHDGRKDPPPEPTRIPRPPAHFLGRDRELAELLKDLDAASGAAVLVQGGPGHGKTALTLALGNHPTLLARFGQARWFVALDVAASDDALRDAVTRAVGADPAGGFRAALEQLTAQPGLLILDNLETPWEPPGERRAVEATLAELAAVPGLALLASFRGRDRVGGPAWRASLVEQLAPPHDTDLFCKIADWRHPDDPDLAPLVSGLGGIPLAIELVAAQAWGLDALGPLRRRWEALGADLAADPDYPPGRLTSLPHSIELSLRSERLTAPARRLFCLLGRLPAGLCEEDRDALLGAEGYDAEARLRRTGLGVAREGRLDLLPPIREHAARHHPPEPADKAAWPAHYLRLTRERGEAVTTQDGEGASARLLPEFPNVEAAFRTALAQGRRADAMTALYGFFRIAYIASLPAPVLTELAAACRDDDDMGGEANCIRHVGDMALRRSDYEKAQASYARAQSLFLQVGDMRGEAVCIARQAEIALNRSDYENARTGYEKARPLFQKSGYAPGAANCTKCLGDIALSQSDLDDARDAYQQARLLFQEAGEVLGEANCVRRLGEVALARGDLEGAQDAYEQARPLFRKVGDPFGETNVIKGLGDIALARSDLDGARAAFDRARPLYQQVGDAQGEANCELGFGDIARARSDHAAARAAYERAQALYRRIGNETWVTVCDERIRDLGRAPNSDQRSAGSKMDR